MIKIDHTRGTQETPPDRPRDNNNTLATPPVKETRALRALLSCVLCHNQRARQCKVLFYWKHWLSYRGETVSGWFG